MNDQTTTTEREDLALLTVYDLGELFRCSTKTIWRMRAKGILPPSFKLGGMVRWRQTDIAEFLRARP